MIYHPLMSLLASSTTKTYAVNLKAFDQIGLNQQLCMIQTPPLNHFLSLYALVYTRLKKKLLELIRQQQHVNVKNYEIVTLHFLVSKLLEGMNRQNNNTDDLMPITKSIFKQILHTLLKVFRDTLLFSAALTLIYFALLNVGDLHHLRITYPIKVLRFRLFESSIILSVYLSNT